jgi:hypothetical protein
VNEPLDSDRSVETAENPPINSHPKAADSYRRTSHYQSFDRFTRFFAPLTNARQYRRRATRGQARIHDFIQNPRFHLPSFIPAQVIGSRKDTTIRKRSAPRLVVGDPRTF